MSAGAKNQKSLLLTSEIFENLSLHIDDVEFLQNAFIAQAITAPLVRYSNRGRYEPYVAKNWTVEGNSWTFQLHEGLTCEDGEVINSASFAKGLKRALQKFSFEEIQQTPFGQLKGIRDFITSNSDENLGIVNSESSLSLIFDRPVGKALLEYLAMTPFAYLCSSNFRDGKWISNERFVSSGPYRVAEFDREKNSCTLSLRTDWQLLVNDQSFGTIYLRRTGRPNQAPTAEVEMTYGKPKVSEPQPGLVLEVPRALMSVRLGIKKEQFFSNRAARRRLQASINEELEATSIPFENYHKAHSFFFGQVTGHEAGVDDGDAVNSPSPSKTLSVRGLPQNARPEVDFYQGLVFKALKRLGWKFELMNKSVKNVSDFHNAEYDIAFDRSHVDATLDPDFIRILFKSKLGPRYQDPGNRVSALVDQFDAGKLTYRDFLIEFNTIISEEAAIIPLFHRGFTWHFSSNVDIRAVSPLMSILRYEELVLKGQ